MSDTQWPRFEVFQQDRPGSPHRSIGSVHAPDEEIALMNARDVFVRRPVCNSLWVVLAEAIFMMTDSELRDLRGFSETPVDGESVEETYYVFQKHSQRRSMTFVVHSGQVLASNPEQALKKALLEHGNDKTFVWWVCPERAIVRSQESDVPTLFEPAESKTYRLPREYRVLTEMLELKSDLEE